MGCGEDGRLLSVVELESLVGGSGERRNQGGLRKEQRNALKEPAASKTRRTPQQERGLIRRTLGRDNACTRRCVCMWLKYRCLRSRFVVELMINIWFASMITA